MPPLYGRALVSRCASAPTKPLLNDISGGLGISGLMDGPAALAAALLTASVPASGPQPSGDGSKWPAKAPCLPELQDALSLTVPALAGAISSRRRPHSKYVTCCSLQTKCAATHVTECCSPDTSTLRRVPRRVYHAGRGGNNGARSAGASRPAVAAKLSPTGLSSLVSWLASASGPSALQLLARQGVVAGIVAAVQAQHLQALEVPHWPGAAA